MKIAVIDSGVWVDHPRLKKCKFSGVGIKVIENCKVEFVNSFEDDNGHGTALCGIIHKKIPEAEIVAVKIKWHQESATEFALIEAIKWCLLDKGIKLINICMGVATNTPHDDLNLICQQAYNHNIAIIASYSNVSYTATYPAFFPTVYGITGCHCKESNDYGYIPDSPIEFVAKGNLQRLASVGEHYVVQEGSSYATAHFTGIVANILQNKTFHNIDQLSQHLIDNCNKTLGRDNVITTPGSSFAQTISMDSDIIGQKVFLPEVALKHLNILGIFPGDDKEMSSFRDFKDMCQFKIGKIINYPKSVLQSPNEIAGFLAQEEYNLFDTLVLGYYIESLFTANILYGDEIVSQCLKRNYNIITWSKQVQERILKLDSSTKKYNAILPGVTQKDLEQLAPFIHCSRVKCPVVLVVGTGNKQGKFTTQLRLKEVLSTEGYKVGHISTEPQGMLFGANYVFPYGKNSTVDVPIQKWGYLLRCIQRGIYHVQKPDIIISGTQSDVMPRRITSSELMLPSLFNSMAYIAGIEPDGIICAINPEDTIEIIERILHAVQLVSKAKLLMFVMRPWTRIEEKKGNIIYRNRSRTLEESEYQSCMEKVSKYFKVPVINIKNKKNDNLILKTIENSF